MKIEGFTLDKNDKPGPLEGGLRLVIMGPPGSGKGTQSPFLQKHFEISHLATGDMLRNAASNGNPIGLKAKEIMAKGEFVPDDIMVQLIDEAINSEECQNGFVLDGFPRTVDQAKKLDNMMHKSGMHLDHVIAFIIPNDILVKRICGRLIHQESGRTYHEEFHPPLVPGRDDITGELLIRRADDNEETLKKRFQLYTNETAPVVEYFRRKGNLLEIDATRSPKEVWKEILKTILDKTPKTPIPSSSSVSLFNSSLPSPSPSSSSSSSLKTSFKSSKNPSPLKTKTESNSKESEIK